MQQNLNLIDIPATKVFLDTWQAVCSKLYKLICQEGSSRSSKTWSDFLVLFKYGYENPNKVITVLRDTATDCRDIVESEWVKWLSDPCGRTTQYEAGKITGEQLNKYLRVENLKPFFTENKTKHIWTFKYGGSTIRFTGLDDDDKVMGMTQNVCWVNEPYSFPHEIYRQLSQRTSDFIIIDWNPKKKHWIDSEKKRETSIVLKSTFKDNPFCPQKQKDQILSYQPVSESEDVLAGRIKEVDVATYDFENNPLKLKVAELLRCLRNESEKTASSYHWNVYGLGTHAELPNRIYRWNTISPVEYNELDLTEYYYSDWGSVDPWAVGKVKYRDGCLYIKELNYESENQIRQRLDTTELVQIGTNEEGLVSWSFGKWGIPQNADIICDTNRRMKILALRNAGWEYAVGLTTKEVGSGKPAIIDRVDLLNNLKVYYTTDSPNIEYEQENYSRKVDRYGIVLEEPADIDNHHMDGIGYVAAFLQAQGIINII